MDDSKTQISLTLWGEQAKNFDHNMYIGETVAVKGASLGTFNGRSLSVGFSSTIEYQLEQSGNEYAQKVVIMLYFKSIEH